MQLNRVCEKWKTQARTARLSSWWRTIRSRARLDLARVLRFAACGWAAPAAAAVLLSGCMLSPGMTFRGMPSGSTVGAAGAAQTAAGRSGSQDATGNDRAPAGSLVEITDDLVAKQQQERPTGVSTDVRNLFAKAEPYVIGPGDVLSIVVWDHPELSMPAATTGGGSNTAGGSAVAPGYTVDTNGFIQYAYIGPIKVQGLSEMGVRDLLTGKLSRYVRQPQMTVRVETYRSKRIYLDGEVRTPGVQVLNDVAMTLPEAINRAGGFTDKSDRSKVSLTRGDETVVVDMPDMIRNNVNPDRIILRDGDLIRVYAQNDSKVFVIGEVQRPGGLPFNNGRMSLNEALGDAGGISQISGDASQVYVVRGRDAGQRVVYHLDATSASAMATADSFELKPNDVVFVDASALVKWSRVIGLILPATQAAATTRAIGY
ncbi:polysaccharide biosynthesis/export family protein [Paraburkholderia hospita]|jgi:polysaccharide export outer membrane protein|uniref:polysaccharide biosynthesis/export family protein n=1 Tax=Paraburkholderia hospita TaxID=169430 RepID=UPI000271C7D7|nr:polysaccharide biosynthesis/export family protein [Paraburkholderia hospita]EUC13558.1 polysaccharide export protein [Burkholderia sp. BT03]SKC78872.1 protein involved in polysaccharide export, contains SLBB domain of the beta-grasp fold [Burkholderia sp. CF099]SOE68034.1 protein involved in polysaccharide export, contains SLBB domain of the beta-grasp fold [Burkholderia sp. YR290]AXE98725.1 sugar transporter [Paraburkholderia hospita]OUL87215.1 sugar transporter [Paraburkholderia hospita]